MRKTILLSLAFFIVIFVFSSFKDKSGYIAKNQHLQRAISIINITNDAHFQWNELSFNEIKDIHLSDFNKIDTRARIFSEAIYLIANKPWFGNGVRSPKVFEELGEKGMSSFHSSIFDILVTYGFIGLVIFSLFLFKIFRFSYKMNIRNKFKVVAIFFTFATASMVQPYLFNIQVYSLFFLVLAIASKKYRLVVY